MSRIFREILEPKMSHWKNQREVEINNRKAKQVRELLASKKVELLTAKAKALQEEFRKLGLKLTISNGWYGGMTNRSTEISVLDEHPFEKESYRELRKLSDFYENLREKAIIEDEKNTTGKNTTWINDFIEKMNNWKG